MTFLVNLIILFILFKEGRSNKLILLGGIHVHMLFLCFLFYFCFNFSSFSLSHLMVTFTRGKFSHLDKRMTINKQVIFVINKKCSWRLIWSGMEASTS